MRWRHNLPVPRLPGTFLFSHRTRLQNNINVLTSTSQIPVMSSKYPPSEDPFARVWDLHCRIQAQDIELLSLQVDNAEYTERAQAIIALRDVRANHSTSRRSAYADIL